MPSTLNLLMKFVWKEQELCIHSEGSHSNEYASIVDEVSRGYDFYMADLVNVTEDDFAQHPLCLPYIK